MLPRFIIHAGFPKCASTSIQGALVRNVGALREAKIFLFGERLTIERNSWSSLPLWTLERLKEEASGQSGVTRQIAQEVTSLASELPGATAVLTSENLHEPVLARLFEGIDSSLDVTVVFYVRPQYEWITSAWKQWPLKSGMALEAWIDHCLAKSIPSYKASVEAWIASVPTSRIAVRLLLRELLSGEDPALDFFDILGVGGRRRQDWLDWSDWSNPSLDYSILYVLSKNPHLFLNIHDNRLTDKLTKFLPEEYLTTNIAMLSFERAREIQEHFRDENFDLLRTYGPPGLDVNDLYKRFFTPSPTEKCFGDEEDAGMANRAARILLEAISRLDR
jgi:hypothetical protein